MTVNDGFHALRCADCARSDSAVTDIDPVQRLELPADALLGFPEGTTASGLSRRRLLQNGVAGALAVYGASQLDWLKVWEAATAEAAAAPNQRKLVVIYLNGGEDGLNRLVPTYGPWYDDYITARPTIGRVAGANAGGRIGCTPLAGLEGLSMANPCMSDAGAAGGVGNGSPLGLDTIWGDGSGGAGSNLALFPSVQYPDASRSHFDSRDYYFMGAMKKLQTGWLGRYLDLHGSQANPLQAVSLDSSLSKQIRTSKAPVCALTGLQGVRFEVPGVERQQADPNEQIRRLASVQASRKNQALRRSRSVYGLTVNVADRLRTLTTVTPGGGYPMGSGLAERLQLAAILLGANLGTRIVTIDWGSFDTHGDQVGAHDPQLSVLSQSLAAFQADLERRGVADDVMTLVFSEFGRRLPENGSVGTDHGNGGVFMVQGSKVRGGMAGEFLGLRGGALDRDGDMRGKDDFRTIYSSILSEWFRVDPTRILPNFASRGLDRHSGPNVLLKSA